jgi:hypothetical protein
LRKNGLCSLQVREDGEKRQDKEQAPGTFGAFQRRSPGLKKRMKKMDRKVVRDLGLSFAGEIELDEGRRKAAWPSPGCLVFVG